MTLRAPQSPQRYSTPREIGIGIVMVAVPVSIAAVVVLAAPPELFMICGQDLCWYNENNSLPVETWFRVMMTNVILGDLTMAIFDGRRLATHNGQTVKCACVCMCIWKHINGMCTNVPMLTNIDKSSGRHRYVSNPH